MLTDGVPEISILTQTFAEWRRDFGKISLVRTGEGVSSLKVIEQSTEQT